MATQVIRTPFRLGRKEVYLPDFKITLLRTPNFPPRFASFIVPLHMNKLDMRDYLYHLYSLRAITIRSSINAPVVRQGHPRDIKPQPKRWYRPAAQKRMTVEMETPFFWPKEIDEETLNKEYNKDTYEAAEVEGQEGRKREGGLGDAYVNHEERRSMRAQARELLRGRERWTPSGEARGAGMGKGPLKAVR